jgi:4-methyl-5(b-hydroxyethyl)-thiazole monophosphate biosynthesis
MSTPTVLLLLSDGFEEMEAIAPLDLLRRAGAEVTVAALSDLQVTGRNGLKVTAEVPLAEVAETSFDAVIVPGGPGHTSLRQNPLVIDLLKRHAADGKLLGAICAAPTVLAEAGLLPAEGSFTGHQSIAGELGELQPDAVVEADNVITSRGAGTATRFGLALVRRLCGKAVADHVAESIHYSNGTAT